MATEHYTVEGIGIDTDKISDRIDTRKLVEFLIAQLPDDDELKEIYEKGEPFEDFDIDNYLYGNPYNCLAEIFADCDDTSQLTYNDNNESKDYVLFQKQYPWEYGENSPRSVQDVHGILIDAVMKITDMTPDEIEDVIDDDIHDYGWG